MGRHPRPRQALATRDAAVSPRALFGTSREGLLRERPSGSEFVPGIHIEAVRNDGTLAGVHSLDGIEGGGDNGSTARVEWTLRPAE
jgi:hypothetical protein